jgi:hypothetical protein
MKGEFLRMLKKVKQIISAFFKKKSNREKREEIGEVYYSD